MDQGLRHRFIEGCPNHFVGRSKTDPKLQTRLGVAQLHMEDTVECGDTSPTIDARGSGPFGDAQPRFDRQPTGEASQLRRTPADQLTLSPREGAHSEFPNRVVLGKKDLPPTFDSNCADAPDALRLFAEQLLSSLDD
jgi:hypothetical protein